MTTEISKSQIDKLGTRLKKGEITEADLRLLDEYRRSFSEAYESVVGAIRIELALEPTGRPAKSTTSISEKLLRESIRLTQVQDIAGCRLIVSEMADQERVVESLERLFDDATVVDRREHPSNGYRAVHVIVKHGGKLVEIQVRTSLQHVWAELSEKLSDVVDPALKYGGGNQQKLDLLTEYSSLITDEESFELELLGEKNRLSVLLLRGNLTEQEQESVLASQRRTEQSQKNVTAIRQRIFRLLRKIGRASCRERVYSSV